MRTSLIALGLLTIGLSHCSSDRGLFVGEERDGDGGGGEAGDTGGTGGGRTGGTGGGSSGGSANSGGTENTGGDPNRGGTGSGAEGGEPSETGGTGGSDRGGTDAGGTDAGGSGGAAGSGTAARAGMGGNGAEAGSGTAARGGMNDGGRAGAAGASNAGAGGTSDTDCEALGREYLQRLAAAQQCSPQLTVEQCTIEMPNDFFCPCKTFVNPLREADIRRMNEILQKRTSCVRICPAIACPTVTRGVCSTAIDTPITGTPGRCTGAT